MTTATVPATTEQVKVLDHRTMTVTEAVETMTKALHHARTHKVELSARLEECIDEVERRLLIANEAAEKMKKRVKIFDHPVSYLANGVTFEVRRIVRQVMDRRHEQAEAAKAFTLANPPVKKLSRKKMRKILQAEAGEKKEKGGDKKNKKGKGR